MDILYIKSSNVDMAIYPLHVHAFYSVTITVLELPHNYAIISGDSNIYSRGDR